MYHIHIATTHHNEFLNITHLVSNMVREKGYKDGVVTVFVPHTTAGITINENADPDVTTDMMGVLNSLVPWDSPKYRHFEGNTSAHVKASIMGNSTHIILEDGNLQLGTWQGIYFCEFDGPRQRKIWVQVTCS